MHEQWIVKKHKHIDTLINRAILASGFAPDSSSAHSAAQFHLQSGGGAARAHITKSIGLATSLSHQDIALLSASVELLHNASLVHDDLIDRDEVRRNQTAVWKKFGDNTAICCGDLLIARAFSACAALSDSSRGAACIQLVSGAIEKTIYGQSLDLSYTDWKTITEQQYRDTLMQKTFPLLALSFQLPLVYANAEYDEARVFEMVKSFALAYQLLDDLSDQQKDSRANRCNYVNLLALTLPREQAMARTHAEVIRALAHCTTLAQQMPEVITAAIQPHVDRLGCEIKLIIPAVSV